MTHSRRLAFVGAILFCAAANAQPSSDAGPTPETAEDLRIQGAIDKELTR